MAAPLSNQPSPNPSPIDTTQAKAIDQRIADHSKTIEKFIDEAFPEPQGDEHGGCSFVIMKEGQPLFSRTIGDHRQRGLDTQQHFASVTKQMTAACVVDLAIAGKLDLEQDIRVYLPHLREFTHAGKRVTITVNDLLQMRSGLPECFTIAFLQGKDIDQLNEQELLEFLSSRSSQSPLELLSKPATEFCYCNANYYLLSQIVEKCSGQNLAVYAEKRLFTPFGMTSTAYINKDVGYINPNANPSTQPLRGYSSSGKEEKTTKEKTWGAGGVIGTAHDMILWDKCAPAMKWWPFLIDCPPGSGYGRGLGKSEDDHYRCITHSGGVDGFSTWYIRVESKKDHAQVFSMFIAANKDCGNSLARLSYRIANLLLMNKPEEPTYEEVVPGPPYCQNRDIHEERVGTYHCDQIGSDIRLEKASRNVDSKPVLALKLTPLARPNSPWPEYFAPLVSDSNTFVALPPTHTPPPTLTFNQNGFTYTNLGSSLKLQFKKVVGV